MSSDSRVEMPWRPTYEAISTLGWGASLIGTLATGAGTNTPLAYSAAMAAISGGCMCYRGWQTKKHFDFRLALAGTEFFRLPVNEVFKRVLPEHMWLGMGWDWEAIHTQRFEDALKRDIKFMLPPKWYRKLKRIPEYKNVVGAPWIHGLNTKEADVQLALDALEGHVGVFGTTGSGKTRFLETVCAQVIDNLKNVLIIIDPKGDKELKEIAQQCCERAGRPEKFLYFHPAFPSKSIRFDPMKNWTRETQLASRIAMLMPTDDSFKQFAWRSINTVAGGLLYIKLRPNLKLIKKYVAGGPDELTVKVLEHFFNKKVGDEWKADIKQLETQAQNNKLVTDLNKGTMPLLVAYVEYYRTRIPEDLREKETEINNLIDLTRHNRDHYGKLIANILPILDMLTFGELGDMLSPDAEDMTDTRPIFDSEKIIEGGYVIYMGLDSLSDATVGSALAGIVLADLASKMGERYNFAKVKGVGRIHLIVDEAAEAINDPMIQLLNKGRGAGLVCWLLTQTFPDFIAKLGSEPKARQILGNLNNMIALRLVDPQTQQFVSEQFGEAYALTSGLSYSTGSRSEDSGMAHQGSVTQSSTETKVPRISMDLLSTLPNLHYIAKVSGGRIIKGRLPKLI